MSGWLGIGKVGEWVTLPAIATYNLKIAIVTAMERITSVISPIAILLVTVQPVKT